MQLQLRAQALLTAGLLTLAIAPAAVAQRRGGTGGAAATATAQTGADQSPAVAAARKPDASAGRVRLEDIADIQGVRGNQLVGYGLVFGLMGTGDGQSAQFTISSIVNMLRRFGVDVTPGQVQVKNVAAVMVTADLPAFAKPGNRIDVTVSSMGDAKSLQGGTLVQTPLRAGNGQIYAVAQGPLSIGGFNVESGGSRSQKNHANVGRIPGGAYVEQSVPMPLTDGRILQITLRDPDFTTATRAAEAIREQLPAVTAEAIDAATITMAIPKDQMADPVAFISRVEAIRLTPDVIAKIVVNERTGTVAISGNVRLAPGAIAHGDISIQVANTPIVIPSPSFSNHPPPPVVVPLKQTTVQESGGQVAAVPATTTVGQLVHALNALGVTPRDLITILQLMHDAGMIDAELDLE